MPYFTNFTNLLHLKVVELGETILPSLGIKSLNDYYSERKEDDWFYDDGRRGFSFDGAMPWASKTPKGREKTLNKPWVQSLIKTPSDMVSLLSEASIFKEGYHLADVLSTSSLICGDDSLFEDYSNFMREYLGKTVKNCHSANVDFKSTYHINPMSWKERILHELVEVSKKYRNFLDDYIRRPGKSYAVKKDIYRFPSLVIQYVGKYFNVQCPSSWDTIGRLVSEKFLPPKGAHSLRMVLGIAVELRLRTYLSKQCQSQHLKTNFQDLICLLQRFFSIAIPLEEAAKKLRDESGLFEVMKSELYNNNSEIKAQVYLQFGKYDKAEEILKGMLVNAHDALPNAVKEEEIAEMLGIALYLQNNTFEASKYFKKALEISEQNYQRNSHSLRNRESLGDSCINCSLVLHEMEQIEEALSYGNKALEIRYSLLEENSTATNKISYLLDVADAHHNLGKFHLKSFLSGNKKSGFISLHHSQHAQDIADILYKPYNTPYHHHTEVLGFQITYYFKTGRWGKVEKLFNDALKALYRSRKYDVFTKSEAKLLDFFGTFALWKNDVEKARFAFNRAYRIRTHIHGENDDDSLVKSLDNLRHLSERENKFKEAESFHTQAKEMSIRIHGEGSDNEFLHSYKESAAMTNWKKRGTLS